jgi:hypothetical protein
MVEQTAHSMKGALQRNESVADKATFHPELFIMDDVPEQLRGMSGHHTIHNAWIVALELVPNPQYRFVDVDYADMYRMARAGVAGLLNWKGIAVSLLDRNAVVQTSIESTPENRRFHLSACQAPRENKYRRTSSVST